MSSYRPRDVKFTLQRLLSKAGTLIIDAFAATAVLEFPQYEVEFVEAPNQRPYQSIVLDDRYPSRSTAWQENSSSISLQPLLY